MRSNWLQHCATEQQLAQFDEEGISRLVAAGVPLDRVQVLAGHTSMEMTRRYAETREASLREAVAAVFG